MTFKNGDVFDIAQTVNGINKFIYIEGKWHYYSEQIMREFEYDQTDLQKLIIDNEYYEVKFLGNIFSLNQISDEEIVQKALEVGYTKTLFIDGAKWYREQLKNKQ